LTKTIEDLLAEHKAELQSLKKEHEQELLICKSFVESGSLVLVKKMAAAAGVSANLWILDAILAASEAHIESVRVSSRVYEKLYALANSRGISVVELTKRSSFEQFIEEGIARGAF